ncbi:MAG TPA: M13 family metallopeptidase, partial [Salegentibacter sp.]|nr:M13 family metallopeptidase [Salegentibacter sp.]
YNPMTVAELQNSVPALDWEKYFSEIGAKELDTIIVAQPKYMKALQGVFTQNNVEDWKTYLKWSIFNDAANALSTEIETANWEFYNKTLQGAQEQRPRDEQALQTINWSIGEALGKLYVDEHFPAEAKEQAEEMIANIIKAYETRINNLSWMSEDTKKKAIEKLGTTTIKVGYPDEWKDYSGLEIANVDEDGSYFQNMMNVSKWRTADNMSKLGEPVDKTEWFMSPQTVNAYYNPSYNEIVFPAAILQPPFYDYKADAAINYGGIGAVIGHEISHGFDDSGARFDAEGNLNNWWTDEDLEAFEKLGGDLADQYSKIEVLDSVFINGQFTLGENIGDLGGVNAAYDGLQIHLEENGHPGEIDGYTPEQRFFMSWATVWRTKMRDEALQSKIKTDPHSPGMYRAYVPLQNIDAFYKAFEIGEEDDMYVAPEDRVIIW